MRNTIIFSSAAVFFLACGENTKHETLRQEALTEPEKTVTKAAYLQSLEKENHISYDKILNTRAAYITSMCYTKTKDKITNVVSNPCYSCHTKGKIPNYFNDTNLQEEYNFPLEVKKNPFSNLFKERSEAVSKMEDNAILQYIRESNYFDSDGNISLATALPQEWEGYRPDCYYNFDDEGMDRTPTGEYTLWRAYRYYPFLGTFWPTNGSTDDVLIRLGSIFSEDENRHFDLAVYRLNLAIVEALVKQKTITLPQSVDETLYEVDLNQNGLFDRASEIVLSTYDKMSYVGAAKTALIQGKVHLAQGLFPEGTEFLHSVRYVDWNDRQNHIVMSKRMKELRYAKKESWRTYSDIERAANAEFQEALITGSDNAVVASFRGDYEHGLKNGLGWIYQGFIEDKKGNLRPQTHEETIGCMGCHSHLGSTTDSIFSFNRKLDGVHKTEYDFGWNHWTQKGLKGLKEQKITYKKFGEKYEYSFYLQNNHSGNEFRNNDEVQEKFFDENVSIKPDMLKKLHQDISLLLFPSKERALSLNKGYKAMVEEQSYIYGRDANVKTMKNVYREIEEGQTTGIEKIIVR